MHLVRGYKPGDLICLSSRFRRDEQVLTFVKPHRPGYAMVRYANGMQMEWSYKNFYRVYRCFNGYLTSERNFEMCVLDATREKWRRNEQT